MLLTLIAAAAIAAAPGAGEVPAKVKFRPTPSYPISCAADARDGDIARVVVAYTVNRDGRTENARVREATNSCFLEPALAEVRSWEFEPRRVNGKFEAQEDLETVLTYKFEAPTNLYDFDARPIERNPPRYPEKCMLAAASHERVLIEFDVTAEGATTNIHAIDATNKCLVKPAENAVIGWRYAPMILDGKPAPRPKVQTYIIFTLSGGYVGVPADRVRKPAWNALRGVNKYLGPKGDPEKALAALAEIEEKYGADFTRTEQAAFHQLRGGVRIDLKNYAGALDDLLLADRLGAPIKDRARFVEMLKALEQIVAERQQAAPAETPNE